MPLLSVRPFADRFPTEQAAFARHIRGLPTEAACRDFASLLLHRLMFVRFLQENDHLDAARYRYRRPSFYRTVLRPFFDEGRGTPGAAGWAGLFLVRDEAADIGDAAFDRLFAFFDEYEWCLADTPPRAEHRLTPAVIGPLFEKHVNRKEQGAYYTKDDVTTYLASRTLLPCLLDAVGPGVPWHLLRSDPDRYIPAAVREPGLLPTETPVEQAARRRRCADLRARLRQGQVAAVADLVTENLDLQRFAEDVAAGLDETTLRHKFLPALHNIMVLDPTCGSGAFLLAALRVLEPLWVGSARGAARRHILSTNLFGVDQMPEAVELCRMRLLLELAAATDAGLGNVAAVVRNIRSGDALPLAADPPSQGSETRHGRPFDWQREFPAVLARGGFDVIVGNPPYLPTRGLRRTYAVSEYRTADCPDVYAWVLERSAGLLRPGGRCGMIVPLSLGFSSAFAACRELLFEVYGANWFASFGRIPAALFAGDIRVRNTLHIGHKTATRGAQYTTRLHRWFEAARPYLLPTLEYVPFDPSCWGGRIPKPNTAALGRALEARLRQKPARLADSLARRPTPHRLYFKKTAYNWLTFCRDLPACFDTAEQPADPTQYDALYLADPVQRDLALLLLNGKWVYAYWCAVGDDFHVARWMFGEFPIDLAQLAPEVAARLLPLARELERVMSTATAFKRNAGKRVGTYNLARCRHVTDRSDRIFAQVLGLADVWDDLELFLGQVVKTEFGAR